MEGLINNRLNNYKHHPNFFKPISAQFPMFKKKCSKCNSKISKSYDFCPSCGNNLISNNRQNYGLLGRNDSPEELNSFPGINDSFLDKILHSTLKMLDKQMREINHSQNPKRINHKINPKNKLNVQFFVNGKKVNPTMNKQQMPQTQQPQQQPQPIQMPEFSKEKLKQIAKLPRIEPNSKIKRLSGKLIYELEVPGVKNLENIMINNLESSIEVKAIAEKAVYYKAINLNLPLIKYSLNNEVIFLELDSKN